MKNWLILGLGVLGLATAACKGSTTNPVTILDSGNGVDAPSVGGCDVLRNAGCNVGERCTWVHSTEMTPDMPALGANACVPDTGTVALGDACVYGPAGDTGYDNCLKGSVCNHGICKQICDNNGGTGPACAATAACVTYDSLFANSGATTTPAGACVPTCNPIDDNDFDGSGTAFVKTGTSCGSNPVTGCYGGISSTASPTFFTCQTPVVGTEMLTHRSAVPMGKQFSDSCMSGYSLAFTGDATGSMTVDCYAFCKPADAYMGNPNPQQPNGSTTVPTHRCSNNDALGLFGATPNPATNSNGEHCMYSWRFEIDMAGVPHFSPSANTVGICWDHTKYMYDANGDGTVDTVVEPCTTTPITVAAGVKTSSAVQLGCMNTALIPTMFNGKGERTVPTRYIENFPELVNLPAQ